MLMGYFPTKYYIWLSCEELFELILENEIQFIWGVFLAFQKSIKKEDVLIYDLPSSHIDIIDNSVVGDVALKPMKYLNKVDDVIKKLVDLAPSAEGIIARGITRIGNTVKGVILIPSKVRQSFYNASVRAKGIVADIFGEAKK